MPVDPNMFTTEEKGALSRGGVVDVGGKRYGLCVGCCCVVQMNKRFFGSFHLCDNTEEENDT